MIEVFDCEQGSPEWFASRLGIPTASEFDTVMARGKGGGESKTRRTYLLKLAGERLTGAPMDSYTNAHMQRGQEMEAEARNLYEMMQDVEPERVGFVRNGAAGASPDSLVGMHGLLEIKTKLAHIQLDVILSDEVPSEHKAQLQGQLWVTGRQWVDFVSYWPGLPPFVKRVFRDEDYIKRISAEVAAFNLDLEEIIARVLNRKLAA